MNTYFDTAVLVKVYVTESDSAVAHSLIQQTAPPLPFTHFHEIEIRNALRLKRHRDEISDAELKGALKHLREDVEGGRLAKPDYDLVAVFHKAEELSAKYAMATGARTLDVLHVAAAVVIGALAFVSFDKRQRKMAEKADLKLLPAIISNANARG